MFNNCKNQKVAELHHLGFKGYIMSTSEGKFKVNAEVFIFNNVVPVKCLFLPVMLKELIFNVKEGLKWTLTISPSLSLTHIISPSFFLSDACSDQMLVLLFFFSGHTEMILFNISRVFCGLGLGWW